MQAGDPHSALRARQGEWTERAADWARLDARVSRARLATFLAAVAVAWLGGETSLFTPWWGALPALAFIALVLRHDSIIRERQRAERAARFYDRNLARIEDRWVGTGSTGDEWRDDDHPYAADLDILGKGSLFEFLSLASTRGGEEALAQYLLAPTSPEVARSRQRGVAELAADESFREAIAVVSDGVVLHPAALRTWAETAHDGGIRTKRVIAASCTASFLLAVAWFASGGPLEPVLVVLAAQTAAALRWRPRVKASCAAGDRALRDLRVLASVLATIEDARFDSPILTELQTRLGGHEQRPSQSIAQLRRLVDRLDARRNELFAPVAALLLWTTHCAFAIETWRQRHGRNIAHWLAVAAECEALSSLAAFHYREPSTHFPELLDSGTELDATELAHPLIGHREVIANDVRLSASRRLWIVSGSNMSGKSTLLRAAGVNVVLAQAGSAVRAARLTLSPFQLGASMRIVDSLQTGTSRFYAEIKRLRLLVDMARNGAPLLFLLDEVLSGTNSHDRRLGAAAVARMLIECGASGFLTTHDLALAALADHPELHAINVHFEDTMVDGRMSFDYRLRSGVVTKSNALELMRAVGLPV